MSSAYLSHRASPHDFIDKGLCQSRGLHISFCTFLGRQSKQMAYEYLTTVGAGFVDINSGEREGGERGGGGEGDVVVVVVTKVVVAY